MTWQLIPRDADTRSAQLWIGGLDEPAPNRAVRILTETGAIDVDPTLFQTWSVGGRARLHWQRVTIPNLAPGTRIDAILEIGGQAGPKATMTTLPETFPVSRPLTLLLTSCFSHRTDRGGRVGSAFSKLNPKPDLKILCGDQVYLDSPYWAYAPVDWPAHELHDRIFEHYRDTWAQNEAGGRGGFNAMLREGANWFLPDDHELWNNAPSASFSRNTWTQAGRAAWRAAADALYDAFQADAPAKNGDRLRKFACGQLSFCLADTRMNRDTERKKFMTDGDLRELTKWIASRTGPAVLTLGQPLFGKPAGWTGRFGDWKLQNFAQFGDLAEAIANAPHSLIVLSGDVHFGRVATGKLRSEADLIEVIASPLTLVEAPGPQQWYRASEKAPDLFPTTPPIVIGTDADSLSPKDHFTRLSFTEKGGLIDLEVEAWEIREGAPPRSYFKKSYPNLH